LGGEGMNLFINQLFIDPQFYLTQLFLVLFSICCHEYAHAQVALWQGDSTAADQGHLTLNPLVQMKPLSIAIMCIIGLAWGQVPVTPSNMRHKYSSALVSFAGPLMNLILFFCFTLLISIFAVFARDSLSESGLFMFQLGAILNFVLFVFNMTPIPPFDGWNVASFFFPKLKTHDSELKSGIMVFGFLIVWVFIGYLFKVAAILTGLLANFLINLFQMMGAG
jgi:Zn-dependent protease